MIRRISTLTAYLLRSLLFSLAGLLFILATLAFWRVFFDPTQTTPEADYYILVITLFGGGLTFLVTLATAGRANRAVNLPFLARLPSRVEHLTATFLAALLFAGALQLLLAALAVWSRPDLTPGRLLEIPPIWLSTNILAAVVALHATELVVRGWSRVFVFGAIALLLFMRNLNVNSLETVTGWSRGFSAYLFGQDLDALGDLFSRLTNWLSGGGLSFLTTIPDLVFWPFRAITVATSSGAFTPLQALAPAVLLLYATILFILAADFFATKDLFLSE